MDLYWKAIAILLVGTVLGLVLGKDMALCLCLCVCTVVLMAVLQYLRPVMDFIRQLSQLASLQEDTVQILMKVLGLGLVSETAGLICTDGGCASFGKVVKLLSGAAVLWVSLPVFQSVIQMIQQILGEV